MIVIRENISKIPFAAQLEIIQNIILKLMTPEIKLYLAYINRDKKL